MDIFSFGVPSVFQESKTSISVRPSFTKMWFFRDLINYIKSLSNCNIPAILYLNS